MKGGGKETEIPIRIIIIITIIGTIIIMATIHRTIIVTI
jgi:hypothetical protein